MHIENFFRYINNLHQKIKFTIEEKSDRELAFLDSSLKRNNGKISVLVHRKPTYTDQYIYYSSHHEASCQESDASSLFNTAYSIITNKDDLTKENARIKQVLKDNGYQETNYIRELLTITACLTHNNKRKPPIPKRKRLEWVWIYRTLKVLLNNYGVYSPKSHKIWSTFYTDSNLRKLLCIPKKPLPDIWLPNLQ